MSDDYRVRLREELLARIKRLLSLDEDQTAAAGEEIDEVLDLLDREEL